jgi:hypothetical protein
MFKYAEKVDDDFLCSICKDVLDNAVTTPCRHTFCKTCISEWIKESYSCPLDKKRLIPSDLIPIPIAFTNLLDRLNVLCKFEEEGCDHKCPRSDLEGHVRRCPFNPTAEFECDKGCGLKLTSVQMGGHQCISSLKKVILNLKFDNEKLTEEVAQLKILESVLKKNVCTALEKMETMKDDHAAQVITLNERHKNATLAIKKDFETAKAKIVQLEQDVEILRRKQKSSVKSRIGSSIRGLYPKKSTERTLTTDGIKWNILLRFAGKRSTPNTPTTPSIPE